MLICKSIKVTFLLSVKLIFISFHCSPRKKGKVSCKDLLLVPQDVNLGRVVLTATQKLIYVRVEPLIFRGFLSNLQGNVLRAKRHL